MNVKIEKNIQIPGFRKKGVKGDRKYPWDEMDVGDSFFIDGKSSIATCACHAGKRLGRKFITKSVDGGTRVWRVE